MKWSKLKKIIFEEISNLAEENESIHPEASDALSRDVVVNKAKKIEKWGGFNFKQLRRLGAGTKGTAYDAGFNKVLKVTSDGSEAKASLSLVNKHHPNITKYYKVARVDFPGRFDSEYLIVQERLYEPDSVLSSLEYGILEGFLERGYQSMGSKTDRPYREAEILRLLDPLRAPEGDLAPEAHTHMKNIMFQIFDGLEFLEAQGIEYVDLWIENLLFRDESTPVIIDLGYSRSRQTAKMDVLERKK
tara:strand:+ start:2035 stop:2772 length:738 start_codon:yes stop_codon:yes gene_type:complete